MAIETGTFETLLLVELRLGLPPLFCWRLAEIKDDWTFILKFHSLFEGVLTKLLEEKLALRKITNEHLTIYDSFYSRVQLAERLKLLDPDYKNYLLSLNHLRNSIIHNIQFINLRLKDYLDSLDEKDFRKAARGLGAGWKNIPLESSPPNYVSALNKLLGNKKTKYVPKTARELFMYICPKATIWNSGVYALDMLSLHFHFEITGGAILSEPDIEAKLQDLLLDPEVIAFEKKWANRFGGNKSDE
jgi:hypothetical protein